MDEACRNRKRNREHLRGFIGGIAKHDALIAGTAFVYTKSDVSRLLADHAFHFESLIAEFVNADTVHDLADQFCIVRLMAAGDLSGDDDGVVFDQAFHRHTAVLVMGEAVRDNRICDLVANLIHMTTGYLFRCVNSTHGSNPPLKCGAAAVCAAAPVIVLLVPIS